MKLVSPPKTMDCVKLYQLFLELKGKVIANKQEIKQLKSECAQKEQTITGLNGKVTELGESLDKAKQDLETVTTDFQALRDDLAKEKQLRDGAGTVAAPPAQTAADPNLTVTVNRELPLMSDGLVEAERKITALKDEITAIKKQAHLESDQKEQYSRREIIRITGVPQTPGENTNVIVSRIAARMGIEVTPNDISVSHRSGRRNGSTPRPILCKFVRREKKHEIIANKRQAGGIKRDDAGNPVKIFIDEDLTAMRARICKKLREDKTPHHTRDGKVFISSGESEFKVYDTPADWESLDWTVSVKKELGIFPKD